MLSVRLLDAIHVRFLHFLPPPPLLGSCYSAQNIFVIVSSENVVLLPDNISYLMISYYLITSLRTI